MRTVIFPMSKTSSPSFSYRMTVLYRFIIAFVFGYACTSLLVSNLTVLFHYSLPKAESIYLAAFVSILFFLGILMAVAALESLVFGSINGQEVGTLRYAAESISNAIPSMDIVVILLGALSAIIDNVPLVAASMGMYTYEMDHSIWHFIAYSAGTGGSMLVIGSAAGIAVMEKEKITFMWYLKKITWLAFAGFIAGALTFLFIEHFIR